MAIDSDFLRCAVCWAPNAHPFDFHRTPTQDAALKTKQAERQRLVAQGWSGPQFISHETRALLCDAHHTEAKALGLADAPLADGLARLRGE